jgi:hypothetical protein
MWVIFVIIIARLFVPANNDHFLAHCFSEIAIYSAIRFSRQSIPAHSSAAIAAAAIAGFAAARHRLLAKSQRSF